MNGTSENVGKERPYVTGSSGENEASEHKYFEHIHILRKRRVWLLWTFEGMGGYLDDRKCKITLCMEESWNTCQSWILPWTYE